MQAAGAAILHHGTQFRGDRSARLLVRTFGARSSFLASERQFQFARQNSASREAEGAQHASQLVRGGLRGFHVLCRELALARTAGGRLKNRTRS